MVTGFSFVVDAADFLFDSHFRSPNYLPDGQVQRSIKTPPRLRIVSALAYKLLGRADPAAARRSTSVRLIQSSAMITALWEGADKDVLNHRKRSGTVPIKMKFIT